MAKPYIHAVSSAKKFGGIYKDYLDIHEFMDTSKSTIADNRQRALTHNSWFISFVIPKVFGDVRTNSDGKNYSVRDIAEQHVLEDYAGRFIPSAQDFLQEIEFHDWMQNGQGQPPSFAKLVKREKNKRIIKWE